MKKFIFQITIFIIFVVSAFFLLLFLADGKTDPYYIRLTTPKQDNLIIGTSRAAQGIQPSIINDVMGIQFFNYAFSALESSYGETYLNSIKRKINPDCSNGTYIVVVNSWNISAAGKDPNDGSKFSETKLLLSKVKNVSVKPNFDYLFKCMGGKYYTILTNKLFSYWELHDDGWLEVSINMDPKINEMRIFSKANEYKENHLKNSNFSELRFKYLKMTIEFLNKHGNVYLVRLPVHELIMESDTSLIPDFNEKISTLVPLTKGYYDMSSLNNMYKYTDGTHLFKESGKDVSQKIAEWIVKNP